MDHRCLKLEHQTSHLSRMTPRRTKSNTRNRCNQAVPLHPSDQWIRVGIGNYYKGEWNHRTMSGTGVYVMHDGNIGRIVCENLLIPFFGIREELNSHVLLSFGACFLFLRKNFWGRQCTVMP